MAVNVEMMGDVVMITDVEITSSFFFITFSRRLIFSQQIMF